MSQRRIPIVSGKVVVLDENDRFVGFLDVGLRTQIKDINPNYKLFKREYKTIRLGTGQRVCKYR